MKNSALALMMIAALLTSDCATRNVVKNREPNFVVIIDKDFLKHRVRYKWYPWNFPTSSLDSNQSVVSTLSLDEGQSSESDSDKGKSEGSATSEEDNSKSKDTCASGASGAGGGCGGMCMGCAVVEAIVCAIVLVYAITHLTIHNVRGTSVRLKALFEGTSPEIYDLSWGINRYYISDENRLSLENGTARLTLIATGTRNLEVIVPAVKLDKREIHTIEFASDGKILADGIVVDSPYTQTEPQPGSGEDLLKRTQEPERYDNGSQN